ncbi:MAG: MAPEG family protein [Pseudomonadota bacterium]
MSPTELTLLGLIVWSLLLVMALGGYRSLLVFKGEKAANGFNPSGEDMQGFGRRLTRAHANCYEFLPLAGLLLVYAIAADQQAATNGLAFAFLGARVLQSVTHMISTNRTAVLVRFAFFIVQIGIIIIWLSTFLGGRS